MKSVMLYMEKREIHILNFIYDIERLAAFDKVTEEKNCTTKIYFLISKLVFGKKKVMLLSI